MDTLTPGELPEPLDMLRPVPPFHAYGYRDLARRYGVSETTIANYRKAREAEPRRRGVPVFPTFGTINKRDDGTGGVPGVNAGDWDRYHDAMRKAQLPLPGDRAPGQRGPDRQPRRRRTQAEGEPDPES